jgi:hypothetical protein
MNRLKEAYSGCMNCGGKVKMKSGGKWIQSAIKNPGSFTKQAQAAGMSVAGFRNKVLSNKGAYSSTTVKRANLAKTLAGMRKGEDGMLNSKKSFSDPMAADAVVNQSAPMLAGNTINRQEQDEMMSMAPRVKAVDPLNLAANTDLNKSIGKPLSPQMQKVKSYQEMLRSKGYDIATDGAWGPQTQKAYEAYINKSKAKTNIPTSSYSNMGPTRANMPGTKQPLNFTPAGSKAPMSSSNNLRMTPMNPALVSRTAEPASVTAAFNNVAKYKKANVKTAATKMSANEALIADRLAKLKAGKYLH